MLTDNDMKRLEEKFVTKSEFSRFSDLVMGLFREQRKEMDERFALVDKRFDIVMNHLDGIAGRLDRMHQEMTIVIGNVDRHDRWIHQVAEKTNTTLEY